MKTLFTTLLIIVCLNANAQSKLNVQAGYKSFGVGYVFQNEDFLNFGVSASIVDSGIVEKRANRNDTSKKVHTFHSDVVPAIFGTVGGTFDRVTITGKGGVAHLQQSIQGEKEPQNIYWAVGVAIDYQINDQFGFIFSYDNINSGMAGITFDF
jgi:hypothetical protein